MKTTNYLPESFKRAQERKEKAIKADQAYLRWAYEKINKALIDEGHGPELVALTVRYFHPLFLRPLCHHSGADKYYRTEVFCDFGDRTTDADLRPNIIAELAANGTALRLCLLDLLYVCELLNTRRQRAAEQHKAENATRKWENKCLPPLAVRCSAALQPLKDFMQLYWVALKFDAPPFPPEPEEDEPPPKEDDSGGSHSGGDREGGGGGFGARPGPSM